MEIDENAVEIIKVKINDIKVNSEIESIKLNFEAKNVNVNDIDLKNATVLKGIWKDVAKLSLGGYKDFLFFKQLYVRDVHNSAIYNTAMDNIGYKRINREWKLVRQPTLEIVVDHIYRYCLYSYIVQSKSEKLIPSPQIELQETEISRELSQPPILPNFDSPFIRKSHQQLSDIPPGEALVDKWRCKVCEYTNNYDLLYCDACTEAGPHANKWRCPKCTFINEKCAISCEVCDTENDTVAATTKVHFKLI